MMGLGKGLGGVNRVGVLRRILKFLWLTQEERKKHFSDNPERNLGLWLDHSVVSYEYTKGVCKHLLFLKIHFYWF